MSDAPVVLPHSGRAPYDAGTWAEVTSQLAMLKESTSVEMLRLVILHFVAKDRSHAGMQDLAKTNGLPGLDAVLQGPMGDEVLHGFLPSLVDLALEMPMLFPEGHLVRLTPDTDGALIRMSRRQVACLLSHMFFCTLLPQEWNKYSVNFRKWHTTVLAPTQAYLKVLLEYFRKVVDANRDSATDGEEVWFARMCLSTSPDWSKDPTPILGETKITCRLSGRMGDQECEAELDFANMDVGFGETGTQEELLFGMSPEMCPVVLINSTLGPKETLVMTGARKIGEYSGYGLGTKYEGPYTTERKTWKNRLVLAMDATNYFGYGRNALGLQLEDVAMKKELNKAFCAFRPFSGQLAELAGLGQPSHIATGHWGCGAFRGDKEVKAVLQVMAATAARCHELFYYCFGDDFFSGRLEKVVQVAHSRGMTVAGFYTALRRFQVAVREEKKESFFDWFLDNNA